MKGYHKYTETQTYPNAARKMKNHTKIMRKYLSRKITKKKSEKYSKEAASIDFGIQTVIICE